MRNNLKEELEWVEVFNEGDIDFDQSSSSKPTLPEDERLFDAYSKAVIKAA